MTPDDDVDVDGRTFVDAEMRPTLPQGQGPRAHSFGLAQRYQDIEEINRGGMGAILRAHDPSTGRDVAIKILQQATPDADLMARFVNEGRITAQLEHPAIVPIHEVGRTSDGHPYLAMKLVRGQSLAELLADDALDLDAALEALIRVCEAVSFAHDRGVIHRDLKPDNVMIGQFGEVLVMDWGLARRIDDAHRPSSTVTPEGPADLTQDGALLGTPKYMSPEQARGEHQRVGRASDIYALGAILYCALTGDAPVDGKTAMGVIENVADGKIVPLTTRNPDVPRELAAVVMKAMAFEPEQRYPDAADLRAELVAYRAGGRLAAARYTPWQIAIKWIARHKALSLAMTLFAVTLVGAIGVELERNRRRRADARDAVEQRMAALPMLDEVAKRLKQRLNSRALDPPKADKHNAEHIKAARDAVFAAESALTLVGSEDALVADRVEAGTLAGMLALLGDDRTSAKIAFDQLARYVSEKRQEQMREWLRRDEQRLINARKARIGEMIADLRRTPFGRAARIDRYRFEISAWLRDRAVSTALLAQLQQVAKDVQARKLTAADRAVVEFAARMLGPLGTRHAKGLVALLSTLDKDVHARRELLDALIAIGDEDLVFRTLMSYRKAVEHEDHALYQRIQLALRNIESSAPIASKEDPADRVVLLIRRGAFEAAERELVALRRDRPGKALTERLAGILHVKRGRLKLGLRELDKAVRLGDAGAEVHNYRSLALLWLERPVEAEAAAREAIKYSSSMMYFATLVRTLLAQGKRERARRMVAIRRTQLDGAERYEELLVVSEMLLELGETDRAQVLLERASRREPGKYMAHFFRARLLASLGRSTEALDSVDKALARYPGENPVELLVLRADCLRLLGRYDEALDVLRGTRLDPGSQFIVQLTRASTYVARWKQGDDARARSALTAADRAAIGDGERAKVWLMRAIYAIQTKNEKGRLAALTRAIDLAPQLVEARLRRARVHIDGRRWTAAITDLDALLAVEPDRAEALELRGSVYQMLGKMTLAGRDYHRALLIDSTLWRAHVNYATLKANIGEFALALTMLRAARRYTPAGKDRAAVEQMIEKIKRKIAENK